MPKPNYFQQYSTTWMHALNRAYFNQFTSSAYKFTPLKRYRGKFYLNQKDENEKTFLYSYRNKKNQKFGVFIPTHIESKVKNQEFKHATLRLTQALGFIRDYQESRDKSENEFFLLPLMDNTNQHWTVLKINLYADKITAEHFENSIRKKPVVKNYLRQMLKNMLNAEMATPFLLRQIDPVNCGPICHNLIRVLARGDQPGILPKTAFHYRNKDFKLLADATKYDAQVALQRKKDDLSASPFLNLDVQEPNKPFFVKHRTMILFGIVVFAIALTIGLSIIFPPTPAIAAVVAATTINTYAFAAMGAVIGAFGTGLIAACFAGAKKVYRTYISKKKVREFIYNEEGVFKGDRTESFTLSRASFDLGKQIAKPNEHKPKKETSGFLQMESVEDVANENSDQPPPEVKTQSGLIKPEDYFKTLVR